MPRRRILPKTKLVLTLRDVNILRLEYRTLLREAKRFPNDKPLQKQTEAMRRNWLRATRDWWASEERRLSLTEQLPGVSVLYMGRDQLSAVLRHPAGRNSEITAKDVINSPAHFKFPVIYSIPVEFGIECDLGMPDGGMKRIIISNEEFAKLGQAKINHPLVILDEEE